jgi:hypothetical protein
MPNDPAAGTPVRRGCRTCRRTHRRMSGVFHGRQHSVVVVARSAQATRASACHCPRLGRRSRRRPTGCPGGRGGRRHFERQPRRGLRRPDQRRTGRRGTSPAQRRWRRHGGRRGVVAAHGCNHQPVAQPTSRRHRPAVEIPGRERRRRLLGQQPGRRVLAVARAPVKHPRPPLRPDRRGGGRRRRQAVGHRGLPRRRANGRRTGTTGAEGALGQERCSAAPRGGSRRAPSPAAGTEGAAQPTAARCLVVVSRRHPLARFGVRDERGGSVRRPTARSASTGAG